MAKKKIDVEMYSYGIYSKWERTSKDLPKLVKITTQIPAEIDIEFGYLLKIKKAKGKLIEFVMKHPPFKDEDGNVRPDFTGEYFIKSNDYEFFLGDTIWEPVDDKKGKWQLLTYIDGTLVADKTLTVV